MQDPHPVRRHERLGRLPDKLSGPYGVQRPLAIKDHRQRFARDELHRQVDRPVGRFPEVIDLGDVWMGNL